MLAFRESMPERNPQGNSGPLDARNPKSFSGPHDQRNPKDVSVSVRPEPVEGLVGEYVEG